MNELEASAAYWAAYLATLPADVPHPSGYTAWSFGDSEEMADVLGELVRSGRKTATSSLLWEYEADDESLPEAGEFSIILDGRARPLGIIETLEVVVLPFDAVPADFAAAEGEGDQSLSYWRKVHWQFFGRSCERMGRLPSVTMPVVCERFALRFV